MDFKNAVKALQIGKKEGKKFRLSTEFGKNPEEELPFPEYPRPQMRRENWTNLNGWWEYAFTETQKMPEQRDGKILVPFSPEGDASGVKRQLLPKEYLWYFRTIQIPQIPAGKRLLLQFGAVDQDAVIYCNGKRAGGHLGGYLSFSVDLTPYLKTGENELAVKVRDETDTDWKGRGKQSLTPGGMFYTAQSGIWQSVWMEWVPETYLERIVITPEYDTASVKVRGFLNGPDAGLTKKITVRESEAPDAKVICVRETRENEAELILGNFAGWSPEHPHLYGVSIEAGEDRIESYFGMRKFGIGKDEKGITRLFLNGKPYFQNGVLDQGYWPESLYTPPSDEAMVYDIKTAKRLGFNMIRKHLKVECARWYSHCDHIGMLVWQDMINGGGTYNLLTISAPLITGIHHKDHDYKKFARTDAIARASYYTELTELIAQLYSCPCICTWVLFNEGWGQFDAAAAAEYAHRLDPSRIIDHASGWHDQKVGKLQSLHVYFRPYHFKKDRLGRAVALTEFGGYTLAVPGHTWGKKRFGYKPLRDEAALADAFRRLYEQQIIPAKEKGLAASVYTQLSDVEDECNGFVTYDRKVVKLPKQLVREISLSLKD
mgnify:CR=1 FL=1